MNVITLPEGSQIEEIGRWRLGGYEFHLKGLPFNNFPIQVGEGYVIRFEGSPGEVWEQSFTYSPVTNITYNLEFGFNLISIPLNLLAQLSTAESMCLDINNQGGSATEVQTLPPGSENVDSNSWNKHVCGNIFDDFSLQDGSGYFVKVTNPSSWIVSE